MVNCSQVKPRHAVFYDECLSSLKFMCEKRPSGSQSSLLEVSLTPTTTPANILRANIFKVDRE